MNPIGRKKNPSSLEKQYTYGLRIDEFQNVFAVDFVVFTSALIDRIGFKLMLKPTLITINSRNDQLTRLKAQKKVS